MVLVGSLMTCVMVVVVDRVVLGLFLGEVLSSMLFRYARACGVVCYFLPSYGEPLICCSVFNLVLCTLLGLFGLFASLCGNVIGASSFSARNASSIDSYIWFKRANHESVVGEFLPLTRYPITCVPSSSNRFSHLMMSTSNTLAPRRTYTSCPASLPITGEG